MRARLAVLLLAMATSPAEDDAVERARQALAADLDVAEADLVLLRAQRVIGSAVGFGCPPGDPSGGYRVSFRAEGRRHWVYVSGERAAVCRGAQRLAKSTRTPGDARERGEPDPELDRLAADARALLAERAGVQEEAITLVRAERVTWTDSSLGCPEPGVQYVQALRPGARVELQAGERTYRYHSDLEERLFLCERSRPPLERPYRTRN